MDAGTYEMGVISFHQARDCVLNEFISSSERFTKLTPLNRKQVLYYLKESVDASHQIRLYIIVQIEKQSFNF